MQNCLHRGSTAGLTSGQRRAVQQQRQTVCRAWQLPSLGSIFQGGSKKQKTIQRPQLVEDILNLVENSNQGLSSSKEEKKEIMDMVLELQQELAGLETTTNKDMLNATWRLLWTSEQETQFIVKNAGFFKTQAGEIYQVIDLANNRLQNVITFPPEGAFVVDSTCQVGGPKRVLFKFKAAELQLPNNKQWKLPPFGEGWFDNIYVDEEVRIARDIRNDVLIVLRDGPPRDFTLAGLDKERREQEEREAIEAAEEASRRARTKK